MSGPSAAEIVAKYEGACICYADGATEANRPCFVCKMTAAITAHAAEARRVALEEAADIAFGLADKEFHATGRNATDRGVAMAHRIKHAIRALLDAPRREDGDGG